MELVQDPSFPLKVGSAFDLEALEAFGFLAMSSETLRDAYERTARFRPLYNVGSRWELEVAGSRMKMRWIAWPIRACSELALQSVNEYQVAEMLASIRKLTQQPHVPAEIAFRHRAPRDRSEHRALLGREPRFEADYDGFEADLAWLDTPIRTKNVRLRDYFEKQCRLVAARFSTDASFTAQVREKLAASMDGRPTDMGGIARALATSERSLHRRLANEGTRFNDLVDQVRREFAEGYLTRPNLSVGEVAYLVGFNDSSAFFKAFRRWNGVTPSHYRESLAGHTG